MSTKRKPWAALLFSLLIPGLGQLYAGKARRGIIVFICGYIVGNIAMAFLIFLDSGPLNVIMCILSMLAFAVFNLVDAWRQASKVGEPEALMPYNRWYVYVGIIVVLVLFDIVVDALPLYRPNTIFGEYHSYRIPATSQEDALLVGDYILADHTAYQNKNPERNDIVVFLLPVDKSTNYVKRIIGLPGETIKIVDKVVYINDEQIENPPTTKFVDSDIRTRSDARDNFEPFVIPDNHYFVMGDNRDNSYDSRYWGTVPRELILGKAVRIYYSEWDWNRIGLSVQ